MRPHGRDVIHTSRPEALGVCDNCGTLYNLHRLKWQWDWAGPRLVNKKLRVCKSCMDRPQQQLRTTLITADPVPVYDPRPESLTVSD